MWYYAMALEDGREYLDVEQDMPITRDGGALLIAFLEIDWEKWLKECEEMIAERMEEGTLSRRFSLWYYHFLKEAGSQHPLIERLIRKQILGNYKIAALDIDPVLGKSPEGIYYWALEHGEEPESAPDEAVRGALRRNFQLVQQLAKVKVAIEPLVDGVMGISGEKSNLLTLQRYCIMRRSAPTYIELAQRVYEEISLDVRVTIDGREMYDNASGKPPSQESIDMIETAKIEAHIYQVSNHLESLVVWEFDYLATNDISLRRCEYCGKYFRPRSVVSRYCNRQVSGKLGKTCKDVGAMTKHQQKVDNDEAKKLYRRVANKLQNWARRNVDIYPDAVRKYKSWLNETQLLLEKVKSGEVPYEQFVAILNHPTKELLGIQSKRSGNGKKAAE